MSIDVNIDEARQALRNDARRTISICRHLIDAEVLNVSQRLDVLLLCSRAHILTGQYTDGRPYADSALSIARRVEDVFHEGRAHNELGIYQFVEQKYDLALQHYSLAERIFKDLDSKDDLSKVYLNVANAYQMNGRTHDSISMYERALQIASDTNDLLTQAKVLLNLTGLYRTVVYDPATAYDCAIRAQAIYAQLNDLVGLAKANTSLGIHYLGEEQYEEALEYFEYALQLRAQGAEPGELLMNYDAILASLIQLGLTERARACVESIKSIKTQLHPQSPHHHWIEASEVRLLLHEGELDKALQQWQNVQHWLDHNGLEHVVVDIEEMLAVQLDLHGRHEESNVLWRTLLDKRVSGDRERAQARLSWFKAKLEVQSVQSEAEIERIKNVDLAAAVERHQELHRENEQYIAFLAHELKSPLNTIRAISAMLSADSNVREEERVEFALEINRISSRMFDLINQTLDVSKHRLHRPGSVTNARTIWEHVVSAMKNNAAEKSIGIHCTCDAAEYLVVASEQSLVTILENLLSNAMKFSPAGSSINVKAQLRGTPSVLTYVHLSVQDQGPGLSPEDAALLFRPFAQLTARPTRDEDSTGLGLHIVHRTVNMLNGRIWCDSAPREGATFHVELPLAESDRT